MYGIEQLSEGSREPILVIDFLAPTSQTRLSTTVAALRPEYPVHRIDPVSDIAQLGYRGLDELTAGYAESWTRAAAPAPVLVVSYCTAAPLGLRLSESLQRTTAVACLLVDASWPDLETLTAEYAEIRTRMRVPVAGDPLPALGRHELFAHLQETLRRDLVSHLATQGVAADHVDRLAAEFVGRCMGWLGFLLAMSRRPTDDAVDGLKTLAEGLRIPAAEVPDAPEPDFSAEVAQRMDTLLASLRAPQP